MLERLIRPMMWGSVLSLLPCSTSSLYASSDEDYKARSVSYWYEQALSSPWGCTSLHEAAQSGNMPVLLACIKAKLPINELDEYGNTPLHLAAQAGQAACVVQLLKAGGDVSVKNKAGKTAQEVAANEQCASLCAQFMNKRGLELELVKQIKKDNTKALAQYVAAGGNVNARDDEGNYSLLCYAVNQKKIKSAIALLTAGAKAEEIGPNERNILMLAAWKGNTELIELLLAKGAQPQYTNGKGETALHEAALRNNLDTLQALMPAYKESNFSPKASKNSTPASCAIAKGNEAILQALLDGGLNPNARVFRPTLLVLAAQANNAAMVKMLIKAGAKVDAKDKEGKAAIDFAKPEIAELLKP